MSYQPFFEAVQVPAGWPLPPHFSLVIPYARTNLVQNGSFETNLTNWSDPASIGSFAARTTTYSYHGAYSMQVTPANATNRSTYEYGGTTALSLTSGVVYAYSAKFLCLTANKAFKMEVVTTGGTVLSTYKFRSTGKWQWVWMLHAETSTASRRIRIGADSHTTVFYVDGVQFEACGSEGNFATTYIDGDQKGFIPGEFPAPYQWSGTPHASTSSRSADTRSGGRVMRLDRYGFLLLAFMGMGLASPQHIVRESSLGDGSVYSQTRKQDRGISLGGRFEAETARRQDQLRGDLEALVDRDLLAKDQPMLLRFEKLTDQDPYVSEGDVLNLPVLYSDGLSGESGNSIVTSANISFTMFLPQILAEREAGSALTVQQSVASINYIIQRTAAGVWQAMGTGFNDGVNDILTAPDGTIYAAGAFTTASGGTALRIAKWTGTAWTNVGNGMNQAINAIAIAPDGTLYAGGAFTTVNGGGTAANYIAKWNGTTWSALGTGMNNKDRKSVV